MASQQQSQQQPSGAWTEPSTWGSRKQGIAFAAGVAVLCVGGLLTAKHARSLTKKQRGGRKARAKAPQQQQPQQQQPVAPAASSKAAQKPAAASQAASSRPVAVTQPKSQDLVTPGEPPALVASASAAAPAPAAASDAPAQTPPTSLSASVVASDSAASAPAASAAPSAAAAAAAEPAAAAAPAVVALPEWEVLKNRGNEFYKVTRLAEAKEMYDRAIQLKPDYIPGLFNRSTLYFHHKDYDAALADLDRILQIDARHAKAWYTRGRVLQVLGKIDEAIECFDKGVELGDAKTANSSLDLLEQLKDAKAKQQQAAAEAEAAAAAAAEAETLEVEPVAASESHEHPTETLETDTPAVVASDEPAAAKAAEELPGAPEVDQVA